MVAFADDDAQKPVKKGRGAGAGGPRKKKIDAGAITLEFDEVYFNIDGLQYLEGVKYTDVKNHHMKKRLADPKIRQKLIDLGLVRIKLFQIG